MPGLGARIGRGGSTMFLQDLARSDCIVIMGANMAENHPVGFRFVMEARERGAEVIHVDPRFTRTSAAATRHVPVRAGSDLAFLGGLINHVLTHDRWFEPFVRHYTNAAVIVDKAFLDTEDLDGVFSGYDPTTGTYDPATWRLPQLEERDKPRSNPATDPTLQHPRCVFQVLKRHFARYTPDLVAKVCGVPEADFLAVANAICDNSGRDRTTAFAYSVAWTQHTTGTQIIACCAILQLLLGNLGRPGGGIMALRGHATIQGSTDIPTLFNLLPGYLPMPTADSAQATLGGYLAEATPPTGWWSNTPKYMVSLLKAYYGPAASEDDEFGYRHLPRIGGDYSFQRMVPMMLDREIRGLFCMGQNPAVGGQNAKLARRGLATLDWLVVRDAFEIESATFWRDGPEARNGEQDPASVATEVFLLPAALTAEKEGSYTNTQRLVQWHDRAVDPPADTRSEAWFVHELARRVRQLYREEGGPGSEQLAAMTWDYPTLSNGEPDLDAVVREINGYVVSDGAPVSGFTELAADGSTACGCWIYAGMLDRDGANHARRRVAGGLADLEWGWSWPANRRTLYNRASADPDGRPWSERKAWVWWDETTARWVGHDVPDFPATKPPDYRPALGAGGVDALPGDAPFIMLADGLGQLFASSLKDGPLPTHYEPYESPVENALHPRRRRNPAAIPVDNARNRYDRSSGRESPFPHVLTTYRLTEHHTGGGMTRFVPWLAELQPEGFAEIDPVLARAAGVGNRDWVVIASPRGSITVRALVTGRVKPLTVEGRTVHQVGLPWHFGWGGIARGPVANELTALVEDPNSLIHEGKSATCSVRRASDAEIAAAREWSRHG